MKKISILQKISLQFLERRNDSSYDRWISEDFPKEAQLRAEVELFVDGLAAGIVCDGSFYNAIITAIETETTPVLCWSPEGIQKMVWDFLLTQFDAFASNYELIDLRFETQEIEANAKVVDSYIYKKNGIYHDSKYISKRFCNDWSDNK